jgi:hypothetical protein
MVAEDALDRYVIKRIVARTLLNPARSFANLMDWRAPWYRDSREGILTYAPPPTEIRTMATARTTEPRRRTGAVRVRGDGACVGGAAEGAYRVASDWQVLLAVNGCKRLGDGANVSGDALVYQLGPRWAPMAGENGRPLHTCWWAV